MTEKKIQGILLVRADTSENWSEANPTLKKNELGFDSTAQKFKIGDGTTDWENLGYIENIKKSSINGNLIIDGVETAIYTLPEDVVHDFNYVHTDNNYTADEKNKLDGVEEGAEVNVQSDWSESSTASDAYIKNKPTKLSDFEDDMVHYIDIINGIKDEHSALVKENPSLLVKTLNGLYIPISYDEETGYFKYFKLNENRFFWTEKINWDTKEIISDFGTKLTNVKESQINGNIVIDGEEVKVYTLPDNISNGDNINIQEIFLGSKQLIPNLKRVTIPIDNNVEEGSENPVQSGAVYSRIRSVNNNLENSINDIKDNYVPNSKLGIANGVATLDAYTKINSSQLPDFIFGQLLYGGTLDVTNDIIIESTTQTVVYAQASDKLLNKKILQIMSKDISLINQEANVNSSTFGWKFMEGVFFIAKEKIQFAGFDFEPGDWLISNGNAWEKIDNSDAVTSVAGRVGNIILTIDDIGELRNSLNAKVDKVDGKQLSTNDFTDEQKTKLDNIKEDELVYDTNYVHTDNNYTSDEKNKLSNIQDEATKVESSTANGNIKINGTETNVYTLPTDVVHDSNYVHTDNNYTATDKNKLDGIDNNAKKVEKSDVNGNIKISGNEVNVYTLPEDVVHDSNYVHTDNNYTTDEKNKLKDVEQGATRILVDENILETSKNPVQNKVIVDELKNYLGVIDCEVLPPVKVVNSPVESGKYVENIYRSDSANALSNYLTSSDYYLYKFSGDNYKRSIYPILAYVENEITYILTNKDGMYILLNYDTGEYESISWSLNTPYYIGKNTIKRIGDMIIGAKNEELKTLISSIPIGTISLNPIIDTKKLYRVPDITDLSKGTPVPNTGTIEKVYFNTKLTVDEVKEIINSLPKDDWVDSAWGVGKDLYLVRPSSGDTSKTIYITDNESGQLVIYAPNLIWVNKNLTDEQGGLIPAGWQTFDNPIELNVEVTNQLYAKPSGTYNEQLSSLFSLTEIQGTGTIDAGHKYYKYNPSKEKFELFGAGGGSSSSSGSSSDVDLSDYYTKSDIDTFLLTKVSKEIGKGLSTNDFTNDEKSKLAGIEEGAEANVQSDFAEEDTTNNSFIKNKPLENLDELPTPTAVPDSGEVGTIYFNTSLKQEEVNKILDSLEYLAIPDLESPIVPIVANEDMSKALIIQRGSGYLEEYDAITSFYRIVYTDTVNGTEEMIYGSIMLDGVIRYDIMEIVTDGTPNGWGLSKITAIDFSNALSSLAPQFNYTSQNEKVKNLISTTPFDNELNKIYRVPHKIENEFGSEVDYYDYYGYQNGRKKIGFVKNEEANPLEVIDTKELENPLIVIEPKAVPNTGYIDKIYFNTKLSVSGVKQIANELTWIDASNIGQSDFSFYPVLGYMNGNYPYVLAFKKYTDGDINLGIINFATMDNPQNFYVDAYGGWIQFDNPYSIGFEALSELSGISIGTENDKLINLIALTPFEHSRENPNVKKDAIYRTSTQQTELVYKGTPVPTTGEVSKIYFNTNLSVSEVTRILERITNGGTSDLTTYNVIYSSIGNGRGLYILAQNGIYLIIDSSSVNESYIFSSASDSNSGLTAGWQGISELDFDGTNSNPNAGLQNDLLSSLISTTPFEQVEQEVPNTVDNYDYYRVKNGRWDKIFESLIEDVKELPTPLLGEAVTVPNTGYVEKVYFNTGMSIEEVGMIISTLTFDATLPAIGVLAGQNTALMIMSMGGQMAIQDFVTQEFYWVNEQIASIMGLTAGWQKGSILEVNSEVSPTFDVELEGQTITVNVGEQNEAIKSLISLTPYFEDVENPEVIKDKIYRVAVPKRGLVMKGTPVPVGEYVEKIYFNTFLSKNKVRELMDKARKEITYKSTQYMVFGNDNKQIGIMSINDNTGYMVITAIADGSVDGITEIIYSTDNITNMTPGPPVGYFSISEFEVNSINEANGIDTGMGIDNQLLSDVFSITPFEPVIDDLPNTVDHYEYYKIVGNKWKLLS